MHNSIGPIDHNTNNISLGSFNLSSNFFPIENKVTFTLTINE